MQLFTLFTHRAPTRVFFSLVLGALAGVGYSLLIPIVLASVGREVPESEAALQTQTFLGIEVVDHRFALLFAGVCLFILLARSLSQVLLTRVGLDATTDLRVQAYRRIDRAPLAQLERIGPSRLIAAITTDVGRIITGATVIPNVLVASVTIIGMLGYVCFLDTHAFWFVIGAIVFGAVTYQIPMFIGNRYFERGRARIDEMQEAIRGLIHGTKELRLHQTKRSRYFAEVLLASEYAVRDNGKRGSTIITLAASYGDLLSFLVIGVVAYVFVSYHAIEGSKMVGVVMALLYISGPVGLILNSVSQIAMAKVSLRSIERIFTQLSEETAVQSVDGIPVWDSVRFENVAFSYQDVGSHFHLGPVDFEIQKGEVTFIVGGNGSGKSTLGKLLSLHYAPAQGEIRFGATRVDDETLTSCRQCIAAIFTDFYLFDRLLGGIAEQDESLVKRYLTDLGLDRKVTIEAGRFSTLALSDGQKKRLALLVAFLEDRELYIFDEWAADQDPLFKDVFYHRILPALKARNKAVVVISHDDRYFHVANQILVMEDGKLIRTERKRQAVPGEARTA